MLTPESAAARFCPNYVTSIPGQNIKLYMTTQTRTLTCHDFYVSVESVSFGVYKNVMVVVVRGQEREGCGRCLFMRNMYRKRDT